MPMCNCNQGRLPCSCKKPPMAVAEFVLLEERPKLHARVAELEGQLASASGLEKSARQLAIEALLRDAAALLKRANRYVSVHPSIGGQQLGRQISSFSSVLLQKAAVELDLNLEEETHA